MLLCSARELSLCKGRTLKNHAKTWQECHQHSKVVSVMKQPENVDGKSANEGGSRVRCYMGVRHQKGVQVNTSPQGAVPYSSGGGKFNLSQTRKTIALNLCWESRGGLGLQGGAC